MPGLTEDSPLRLASDRLKDRPINSNSLHDGRTERLFCAARVTSLVLILCFMFAFWGCAAAPGGKPKQVAPPDTSMAVGLVDTSVFLNGQIGKILFSRTSPQADLWNADTDPQGYFWSKLPSGTYRLERVLVSDSSGKKVFEWVSPSEEETVEFEVADHGTVVFVGPFKFIPAWKETKASAGTMTVISLGNKVGIDRVEKLTEKEVLSWLLRNRTYQSSSERDAIRLRMNQIAAQVGSD